MSAWRRYDSPLLPAFHERFEERWGKGSAPFLDPEVQDQPMPRAQWINIDTGAALAVVPIWADDDAHRTFAMFYLPPAGGIWLLRPGVTGYVESHHLEDIALRNDAFTKAVGHARAFIAGTLDR